jgi:pantoate--beta-alanine ligase
MHIFREIKPLMAFLREKKIDGNTIGFVPTMGALHAGHLALIQASKNAGCYTVCSIFVNPTQFNNPNDLEKYPRTYQADVALTEKEKCDVLFVPTVEEMYSVKSYTSFDFGHLDKTMEGAFRPGHFSGVALVVAKLFNIVAPSHAFFGQKDWQQFTIVNRLVQDLNFTIQLHAVPTIRESDGLAMSSRNQRLTATQRTKAIALHQILQNAKRGLQNGDSMSTVVASAKEFIEGDSELKLEYLELAHRENLIPLQTVEELDQSVLCIAVWVGDVRLIDNLLL